MAKTASPTPQFRLLVVSAEPDFFTFVKKILSEVASPTFVMDHSLQFRRAIDAGPEMQLDAVIWDLSGTSKVKQDIAEWRKMRRREALIAVSDQVPSEFPPDSFEDHLTKKTLSGALLARAIGYAAERKRTEEKLLALAEIELEFVSMISHEIRAPLGIVKESVSLVYDKILGKTNEKQQHVLSIARRNINRIDQIIMSLVSISKIEAHRMELEKEAVDVVGLVKQIILEHSSRASALGYPIKLITPRESIQIEADKKRLLEVLNHLVGNAVKFTEKGMVEVKLSETDKKITCSIQDTGVGIADEDQPKIFGKFQQFGWVPGGGEKGMGLGLAIAKGLIELHGGKIKMESRLGQGSMLSFELPKGSCG